MLRSRTLQYHPSPICLDQHPPSLPPCLPAPCFLLQAVQAEASRDVAVQELLRPSAFPALAPELLQLYNSALTLGDAARAAGTPGSAWRRRSSRGAAADEEEAAAAAAVEAVAAEQEAGGASPGGRLSLASAGGASDFGPMSAGGGFDGQYGEEDWIEPADTQQEQQLQAEVRLGRGRRGGASAAGFCLRPPTPAVPATLSSRSRCSRFVPPFLRQQPCSPPLKRSWVGQRGLRRRSAAAACRCRRCPTAARSRQSWAQ